MNANRPPTNNSRVAYAQSYQQIPTLKMDITHGVVGGMQIGDTISKVLTYVQMNVQTFGKLELVAAKADLRQPLYLILPESGLKMTFDEKHQTLTEIEIYLENVKKRIGYMISREALLGQSRVTYQQLNALLGPTLPPKINGNMAMLAYEGASFVFKYTIQLESDDGMMQYLDQTLLTVENNLSKIIITATEYNKNQHDRRVRILLDEGIEIYNAADSDSESTFVLFDDHKMDVLRILGNPNKEYYKDESLFLNYLELGIDIMIGTDYRVSKFILHTNYPYHPHFCFYNRCFFELDLNSSDSDPKQQHNSDSREDQHSNMTMSPPLSTIESLLLQEEEHKEVASAGVSKQVKKRKNKKRKPQTLSQHIQQAGVDRHIVLPVVTPLSLFSKAKEVLKSLSPPQQFDGKQPPFFVRNITPEFTTQYHAFQSIIIEVMPETDYIASVTLFKNV